MKPVAVPGRSLNIKGTMANVPPVPKLTVIPNTARMSTDQTTLPVRPATVSNIMVVVIDRSANINQWILGA